MATKGHADTRSHAVLDDGADDVVGRIPFRQPRFQSLREATSTRDASCFLAFRIERSEHCEAERSEDNPMKIFLNVTMVVSFMVGIPVTLLALRDCLGSGVDAETKQGAFIALMTFGLPLDLLGTWIAVTMYRRFQRNKTLSRERALTELMQQHHGKVDVRAFAARANMTVEEAKKYLNDEAMKKGAGLQVDTTSTETYQR